MILFLFSLLFFIFSIIKHKIKFNNPFPFIYIGFLLLYTGTCFLSVYFGIAVSFKIKLLTKEIIDDYLFYSSLSIITFSLCLVVDKKLYAKRSKAVYILDENNNRITYFIIYIICYPIALYLASISNWTYGERTGLIPSLSAYFKNVITVLTIVFFSFKNMKKKSKLFFMFLFLVITFKSTQRTNFLIVVLAYVYTIQKSKKVFKLGFLTVLALLVLGAARNGVSVFNLAYPIFGEGLFGSWGTLNSINEVQQYGFSSDNLLRGLNGFLNFFLKFLNLSLPEVSFELTNKGIDYYPMGGFFFLSDAILFNPIVGPILYTVFIYSIYRVGYKNLLKKRNAESLLYMGLLFELIKASQSTIMAMFVFNFLFLFFLRCLDKCIKLSCKSNKNFSSWLNKN